jgi:hypothetical protein
MTALDSLTESRMVEATCMVCGSNRPQSAVYGHAVHERVVKIDCPECGPFIATGSLSDRPLIERDVSESDRQHVSGWIRDRWRRGEENIVVSRERADLVMKEVPRLTPAEKVDRLVILLARLSRVPGEEIDRVSIRPSDAWAETPAELSIYNERLIDRHLIDSFERAPRYRLTFNGWAEADRLAHLRIGTGTRAFVAMSFDPSLDETYLQGLASGVKAASFEPFRMKEDIHSERIDARIIAELRACRFVVADVTLNRPAVYYEAGYAHGLGKTVIWTCRKDWEDKMCFDTRQFLHILWDEPADLRSQLIPVIQALIV